MHPDTPKSGVEEDQEEEVVPGSANRVPKLHHRLAAVATLLAGFVGSGLFAHAFATHAAPGAAARPSLRRVPGVKVDLEIVLPDGTSRHTARHARLDMAAIGTVEIAGRQVELTHHTGDGDLLTVAAHAPADGSLTAFAAIASEGPRSVWRLPLAAGLATLRIRVTREYLAL